MNDIRRKPLTVRHPSRLSVTDVTSRDDVCLESSLGPEAHELP